MAGVLGTSDDRLVLKHNANPDHDDRIERNPFTSNYPLLGSNFDHGSAGYGPDLFPSHPPSWQGFQPLPNGSASWDIPFVDGPWGSFADFYSHDAKRKVQDINSAPNEDAVSCYSACGASCPSQCGETGKAICCDDDECVSVQICRDEQCQEARHPCSDKSCIGTPISPHVDPFNPYKGGDEAAARALTSFGHEWGPGTLDDGVEMDYQGFEDTTMGLYTATGDYELPGMIPCSELSSDAFFTDILGSSLDTHKLPAEIYLARHIVQRHLQVGPGSHHPPCVTDNPGQVISECSLPVPSQHDLMPKDTCGFVVQDPAEFVNHISLHHGLQILPPSWSDLPLDSLPASSGISTQSFDHSMGLSATDQTLSPAMIMQANEPWHSRRSSGSSGSSSQSAGFSPSQKPSRTPATPISTPASLRRTLLHGSSESNAENAQSLQSKASHIKGSNEPPNQLHTTHDQIAECQWVMGDGGEICGRKFASTHLLQAHCKNDHTHRLRMSGCGYWCKWSGCERTEPFQQISKLDRHLQSHTKDKPFVCSICNERFSGKQALQQHSTRHNGEKPWVCSWADCHKKFAQQSALTMHMRTHTGEKPLVCETCGAAFSESSNLAKHRRIHAEKRRYECEVCHKDFNRLDQVKRHISTTHPKRKGELGSILLRERMRATKCAMDQKSAAAKAAGRP